MHTDPEQAWFWTPAWQAGEREASAQIAAGGLRVYDDMADLFADIDRSVGLWPRLRPAALTAAAVLAVELLAEAARRAQHRRTARRGARQGDVGEQFDGG
jgi:class 3 adenylate cyclase